MNTKPDAQQKTQDIKIGLQWNTEEFRSLDKETKLPATTHDEYVVTSILRGLTTDPLPFERMQMDGKMAIVLSELSDKQSPVYQVLSEDLSDPTVARMLSRYLPDIINERHTDIAKALGGELFVIGSAPIAALSSLKKIDSRLRHHDKDLTEMAKGMGYANGCILPIMLGNLDEALSSIQAGHLPDQAIIVDGLTRLANHCIKRNSASKSLAPIVARYGEALALQGLDDKELFFAPELAVMRSKHWEMMSKAAQGSAGAISFEKYKSLFKQTHGMPVNVLCSFDLFRSNSADDFDRMVSLMEAAA